MILHIVMVDSLLDVFGVFKWDSMADGVTNSLKGFDQYEMLLGDELRGERATIGKSLLDVQRDLKIKASYIAAIENCDPTVFESQGFIAGSVRSYARYLELDPANHQALRMSVQSAGMVGDKAFADKVLNLMERHNPSALPLAKSYIENAFSN